MAGRFPAAVPKAGQSEDEARRERMKPFLELGAAAGIKFDVRTPVVPHTTTHEHATTKHRHAAQLNAHTIETVCVTSALHIYVPHTFQLDVVAQYQPVESQRLLLWAGRYGLQARCRPLLMVVLMLVV